MPSIYDIKPAFQNLLRPLSERCVQAGITPNQVTMAAILLSFVTGVYIALFSHRHLPLLFVPIALLLRMMLNAIDGMIAREHAMQSKLGTFLNELGDVLSDTFIFLPFALVPDLSPMLIIFIVVLAIVSEMAGVVALQVGAKRRYDGPMGKSDRAFAFGVIALYFGLGFTAGILVNMVLIVILVLLIVTIVNRVKSALRESV